MAFKDKLGSCFGLVLEVEVLEAVKGTFLGVKQVFGVGKTSQLKAHASFCGVEEYLDTH